MMTWRLLNYYSAVGENHDDNLIVFSLINLLCTHLKTRPECGTSLKGENHVEGWLAGVVDDLCMSVYGLFYP